MFGDDAPSPQDELTPCRPNSPYGVAKLASHQLVGLAREHDGLHASSAVLYNHESERRPERYVTRKVTRAAAAISLGLAGELVLGDLEAVRDWSAARDVVRGLRAIAAAEDADDYVLASGVGRTVRELVEVAFASSGSTRRATSESIHASCASPTAVRRSATRRAPPSVSAGVRRRRSPT